MIARLSTLILFYCLSSSSSTSMRNYDENDPVSIFAAGNRHTIHFASRKCNYNHNDVFVNRYGFSATFFAVRAHYCFDCGYPFRVSKDGLFANYGYKFVLFSEQPVDIFLCEFRTTFIKQFYCCIPPIAIIELDEQFSK